MYQIKQFTYYFLTHKFSQEHNYILKLKETIKLE